MIQKEKFSFASSQNQALSARRWVPDGDIRGIVQLVHGMAEHIDRYDRVAEALAGKGFLVTGHNHLGHGEETPLKGYFGDKNGWQALVDDVHRLRELTEKKYPGIPFFLLGHSMGSFVVRCYLMEHSAGLKGAILSGTGSFSSGTVSGGLAVSELICLTGGAKKESPFINKIGFSSSNKPFAPNRTEFDWLSRDEKEVDKYVADPWCGFLFTASGYRDMFRGLKRMSEKVGLQRMQKDLPVLFISGEQDPVGGMGSGVKKAAEDFRSVGMQNVTVRLYPGARHELFNEVNRDEVYADLISWIQQVLIQS